MNDERIILSAIAQGSISDVTASGVFRWKFDPPYDELLKACQLLNVRGQQISLLNLFSECNLEASEWAGIRELWQEAKTAAKLDWRPAAQRIVSKSMKEQGLNVVEDAERKLQSSPDPRETLTSTITKLSALVDNATVYNSTPSFHYKEGVMGEVTGSTGLRSLDRLLGGGLWSQAVVGVAFPSSHGKSTLSYSVLAKAVEQAKRSVLFTFETNTTTAVARILSALTGIPMSVCLKRKGRGAEEQAVMDTALDKIDKYFKIYDLSFNNPSKMEQVIRLEDPEIGVVDHIDCLDPNSASKNASRNDAVGDVADASLQWTIKYGMTMFLNSQLSNAKQAELKRNHDLVQVDLFGSSRVFNAMDFVVIGLRHWAIPNTQYLRLKKNRKIGIVDIDCNMYHNVYTQSFEDIP